MKLIEKTEKVVKQVTVGRKEMENKSTKENPCIFFFSRSVSIEWPFHISKHQLLFLFIY